MNSLLAGLLSRHLINIAGVLLALSIGTSVSAAINGLPDPKPDEPTSALGRTVDRKMEDHRQEAWNGMSQNSGGLPECRVFVNELGDMWLEAVPQETEEPPTIIFLSYRPAILNPILP